MTVRVLVIDSEPAAGASFRALLGGAGYESVWLERGEEALQLIGRVPFDLVVTELGLDGMDGIEICRRLLELRPSLPVIVHTDSPTVTGAVESFRAGARDFVAKSESESAVLEAMSRALSTPCAPQSGSFAHGFAAHDALCSMEEVERQHVARVLQAVGGNKREAARILKLDRTTLYRKLKRYGIPSQRRSSPSATRTPEVEPEEARAGHAS